MLFRRKNSIQISKYIHLSEQNNVQNNIKIFILYLRIKMHSSEFMFILYVGIFNIILLLALVRKNI